jgi:hypothetical protein
MYQVEFRPRAAQDFDNLHEVAPDCVLKKLPRLVENSVSVAAEPRTQRSCPKNRSIATGSHSLYRL